MPGLEIIRREATFLVRADVDPIALHLKNCTDDAD